MGLLNMQTRKVDSVVPANNYSGGALQPGAPQPLLHRGHRSQSEFDFRLRRRPPLQSNLRHRRNLGLGRFANWYNYAAFTQTRGSRAETTPIPPSWRTTIPSTSSGLANLEVGGHFNPEVGFVPRAGYRKTNYFYRFHNYPNSGPIRSWEPHASRRAWYSLENSDLDPTSSTTTWIPSGITAPAWVSPGTETSSVWTNPWRWCPGSSFRRDGMAMTRSSPTTAPTPACRSSSAAPPRSAASTTARSAAST